eukprot:TRINITY_DN23806_c0_g1_i1.p1 TRINITY_DN23806_c0_g1~~TRINITY_DN23806_c0_g1_i1.p1  ORF type:complete len:2525 (+),score=466.54 TRINITY_DN23806_c0_g1_i1:530-7576(+)
MRPQSPDKVGERTALPGPTWPVLFVNPSHPLAKLPDTLSRQDFVAEIRRRLRVNRLFKSHRAQPHESGQTVDATLTVDEAEDLFEVLLQLQRIAGGVISSSLQFGKQMDSTVDLYFNLCFLRRCVERGAPSVNAFLAGLGGKDPKLVDPMLLRQFLELTNVRLTGESPYSGADTIPADALVKANAGIEMVELRRRLSLVAPVGTSLIETQSHLEVRHGHGRSRIPAPMDVSRLYDHFCEFEHLDIAPEDVSRCFRMWGGSPGGNLSPGDIDEIIKRMPLEAVWGIEPFARPVNQVWCAIGTRCLQLERKNKMDACLPPEAIIEVKGPKADDKADRSSEPRKSSATEIDEEADRPSETQLRERFDRLWSRCVGDGLYLPTPGDDGSSKEKPQERNERHKEREKLGNAQMKEACFSRYLLHARNISAQISRLSYQSVFANIGDVLMVSSVHLRAGQAVIVRYRLTGSSNYWHPEHRVLKDEREPLRWPVPRKVLGETPFVALVPRGLRWTSAGGGGFYLGTQAFNQVDPGLRADLPLDRETGQPVLFGSVELVAPFLLRGNRRNASAATEDFEFRLFSSRKNRIIGCVGEPVQVQVVHQPRPPPMATMQVCCDGSSAKLKWAALDLGPDAPEAPVETIRLHVKTDRNEEYMLNLNPGKTEYELEDLVPDTEYDFHLRLESNVATGREVSCTCRTNARCSQPLSIIGKSGSTTHVELQWKAPDHLGNEHTRDRFQQKPESIIRYEAKLTVTEERPRMARRGSISLKCSHEMDEETETGKGPHSRYCIWEVGSWVTKEDGHLLAQLHGLRPDTNYTLEGFCAVNSMGHGIPAKDTLFWTMPLHPIIDSIKVRQGKVLVTLTETGGLNVTKFEASVCLEGVKTETFEKEEKTLQQPANGAEGLRELPLPFGHMPEAKHGDQRDALHKVKVRAMNAGGWSEWSPEVETVAIARQQGADAAQALLEKAMEQRCTTELAQVLHDVRDIEFGDDRIVNQASELLKVLEAVKEKVEKAMEVRDPPKLEEALASAHDVQLPGLEKAEDLLDNLQAVCEKLDTARGIEDLRLALKAGHEARLPAAILQRAVERLGTREAAQQGLEMAIEAARVRILTAALETAKNMHLPSEEEARTLLEAISKSEKLLQDALVSQKITDLANALESAEKSGLREEDLHARASALHAKQVDTRDRSAERLRAAMEARYPAELQDALEVAAAAQVSQDQILEGSKLLDDLNGLLHRVEAAVDSAERAKSLAASSDAKVPMPLLVAAETQLSCLNDLHVALNAGDVPETWRALKLATVAGVKDLELAEPRRVHKRWEELSREVEIAESLSDAVRLSVALKNTEGSGICEDSLAAARASLAAIKLRDEAEVQLRHAIETCIAENIQRALRTACDAEVSNHVLVEAARALLDRLLHLRLKLAKAVESMDMERLYGALQDAKQQDGLTTKDVANAERMLGELQEAEHARLERHLKQAKADADFRAIQGVKTRAEWAMGKGMHADSLGLEDAMALAKGFQEENLQRLQEDLHKHRVKSDWPALLDDYPDDTDPSQTHIPRELDVVNLPTSVVSGDIQLEFYPRGITKELITLPRDIVEVSIRVMVPDQSSKSSGNALQDAFDACEQLLSTIQSMLNPEDSLERMTSMEVQDDGAYRHVFIPISLYLRGQHGCMDMIEAFFRDAEVAEQTAREECELEDVGSDMGSVEQSPHGQASAPPRATAAVDLAIKTRPVLRSLGSQIRCLTPKVELPDLGRGCLHNVRGRVLRRIHAELFWVQPANFQETMDATCIAMSGDSLVEVVNSAGLHGAQYGVDQNAFRVATKGVDSLFGAIRHVGTDRVHNAPEGRPDDGKRQCKHILQVRLDLLPERVTDLFFIVAATNARELSKFSNLGFRIMDTAIGAELAKSRGEIQVLSHEAVVVLCSIYKLDDKRWRIGSTRIMCSGSPRDYKPAINKLADYGYPRNRGMASQEHVLLEAIRRNLEVPRVSVKPVVVNISPSNCLMLKYAIEVMEGDKAEKDLLHTSSVIDPHTMARGDTLAKRIMLPEFHQAVLDEIFRFTNEKVNPERLRVMESYVKPLSYLGIEVRWEFSEVKRNDNKDHSFLDAALLTFSKRNLQEVIDYRGPHGVRIVHNSVVDYAGMWVGPAGSGDAANGAVSYTGLTLDELPRTGLQSFRVRIDKLPPNTTDLYVALSSPSGRELSKYSNISVSVVDGDLPTHEVSMCLLKSKPSADGMIFCRISRAKCASCGSTSQNSSWKVGAFRSPASGGAHDFRPVIASIRGIQSRQYEACNEWPHKISLLGPNHRDLRANRRLLPLQELRKKEEKMKRQDSHGSLASLVNWSPSKARNADGMFGNHLD